MLEITLLDAPVGHPGGTITGRATGITSTEPVTAHLVLVAATLHDAPPSEVVMSRGDVDASGSFSLVIPVGSPLSMRGEEVRVRWSVEVHHDGEVADAPISIRSAEIGEAPDGVMTTWARWQTTQRVFGALVEVYIVFIGAIMGGMLGMAVDLLILDEVIVTFPAVVLGALGAVVVWYRTRERGGPILGPLHPGEVMQVEDERPWRLEVLEEWVMIEERRLRSGGVVKDRVWRTHRSVIAHGDGPAEVQIPEDGPTNLLLENHRVRWVLRTEGAQRLLVVVPRAVSET